MNATAESLIQAARKVCSEIERFDVNDSQKLRSALICLLYNADNFFDAFRSDEELDTSDEVALPRSLECLSEELVFYVVFDPHHPESVCALSLKDPLSDIYNSLMLGLGCLETIPDKKTAVLAMWKTEYLFHWGRHLIDLIRFFMLVETGGVAH